MAHMVDAFFLWLVAVLFVCFLVCCIYIACFQREARTNEQRHPRAPAVPPPPHPGYGAQNDERLMAPVVLVHFPYAARARAASEPPPVCAICLDGLRQGQLCSEVLACRHIFHEWCIRVWAKKNNSCPLCRARVVLLRAACGVAAADDMV